MKIKYVFLLLVSCLLLQGCEQNNNGNPSPETMEKIEKPLQVVSDDWQKGSFGSKVTIIEYADFQCPACGSYNPVVKRLEQELGNKILIVFRHMPLTNIHKNALPAAKSAEAAGRQGKFFEMSDVLFEKQEEWSNLADPENQFKDYAKQIGLNVDQFTTDFKDPSIDKHIKRDVQSAYQLGVNGTPTFFVNGMKINNPRSYDEFKVLIETLLTNAGVTLEKDAPPSKTQSQTQAYQEPVHEHADFKVYLSEKAIDFSKPEYQSTDTHHLHEYIHLHDGNGNIIHKHKKEVTIGDFFSSLDITFNKDCFNFGIAYSFCQNSNPVLYVNGKALDATYDYEFNDLDKILITTSTDKTTIDKQLASITDDACLYSETCPERGKPPTENCVGGLGTQC